MSGHANTQEFGASRAAGTHARPRSGRRLDRRVLSAFALTEEVLREIDAQDVPRFRIFNKIDHVGDAAVQAEREAALRADYPGAMR
jgi:hypothetical protein